MASLAAWAWLAGATPFAPHAHTLDTPSFALTVTMWQAMVVAMMAPVVAPWMAAYARLLAPAGAAPTLGATASFVAGYFLVWLAYSTAAAALHVTLQRLGLLGPGGMAGMAGGVVLAGAGLVQFLPVRRACLRHCRNPLTYLLARWRNGPPGGLRLGVTHGAYCLGCCWLLMLTGLAMGVMNLAWMAGLTSVLVVEQTLPFGERVGRAFGVLLVALGAWTLVG